MVTRILAVGLTGGIACGKSVVTEELGTLGAIILDADEIVHKMLRPTGSAHAPVLERFGEEVLDDRGCIDREFLGRKIFTDPRERWALNSIIHPLVIQEEERLHQEIRLFGEDRIVVTDAALLIEAGTHQRFDKLVVVFCSEEEQLRRLVIRDGIDHDEARLRVQAQMRVDEKLKLADYTVDTTGSENDTRARARDLFTTLQTDLSKKIG